MGLRPLLKWRYMEKTVKELKREIEEIEHEILSWDEIKKTQNTYAEICHSRAVGLLKDIIEYKKKKI